MTPRKVSIGELLGEYERRPIILPEFQRPYSWEKTQVATFWGDLKTFRDRYAKHPIDAAYFLGPVVVLETKQDITVLDGQQRLATATILLAAIRDIARECYGSSNFSELDYLARDVQRELIEKKDTIPLVYSLKLGELDEPFFLQTIKSDPPAKTKSRLRSHQLIQRAYEYLQAEISALVKGGEECSGTNCYPATV